VIKGLKEGVRISNKQEQQSLNKWKHLFEGDDTRAYLMIPKSTQKKDPVLYQNQYEARWTKMKEAIGDIVLVLKNKDHWGYHKYDLVRDPKRHVIELGTKARGTILLKYNPKDIFKDGD
jgi:hypothetical protein